MPKSMQVISMQVYGLNYQCEHPCIPITQITPGGVKLSLLLHKIME